MDLLVKFSVIIAIITLVMYIWRKEVLKFFSKSDRENLSNGSNRETTPQNSYNLNRVTIDYSKPSENDATSALEESAPEGDIPKGLKFLEEFEKLNKKNT